MPDAAAEGGDVDHGGIRRVRNHAVAPFESVAADALPGGAGIVGAPGRGVEAASVDHLGILRVHRHVVDVLRLLENGLPGGAGVGGQEHASTQIDIGAFLSPGGKVHAPVVARIQSKSGRTGYVLRQTDPFPMLRSVARPIQRAGAALGGLAIAGLGIAGLSLAAPRHHQIERAVLGPSQPPGEWRFALHTVVPERPRFPVVRGLVDTASKAAGVQRPRTGGAGRIEQEVGYRGRGHALVRRPPGLAAVGRDAHTTHERPGIAIPPHLRTRQVVDPAECTPDPPFHLGIEDHPVGCVAPLRGNPVGGRSPGGAAVVAMESADVGVADDEVPGIEGIEVYAVAGSHVQAARGPGIVAHAHGGHRLPGLAPIECAVGAEQVGGIADVRVAGRYAQTPGCVEKDVLPAFERAALDPGRQHVLCRPIRFAVDDSPGASAVDGPADAVGNVLFVLARLHAPESRIGHASVPGGCGDGPEPARGRALR